MESIVETIYQFALSNLVETKLKKVEEEIKIWSGKKNGYYHQKDLYRQRAKLLRRLK